VERVPPVGTATLSGARAVGIVCAVAFVAPVILSVVFPQAFLFAPYHDAYQRMLSATLLAFSLGLALALRDPVRNAGVYAVIGLASGFLTGAIAYTLVVEPGQDALHWFVQVPLLGLRIVVVAVVLFPIALFVYDLALRSFVRH